RTVRRLRRAPASTPGARVLVRPVLRLPCRCPGFPRRYAALRAAPRWNASTSLVQNAGRSSGLRLVTRTFGPLVSTCTSSSTHSPPALRMSVCRLGHDVRVRPRTRSASTIVHGPWQITAAGLPASNRARTNDTDASSMRSWSGLATPPGSTMPSKSFTVTSLAARRASNVSPLSRWLKACTLPAFGATSSGVPPASSTAFHGSVSSTCSTPSLATRNAIFLPCNSLAMRDAYPPGRRAFARTCFNRAVDIDLPAEDDPRRLEVRAWLESHPDPTPAQLVEAGFVVHVNDEQQQRYLSQMLRGEEVWCQLFSEGNAGSDLANLSTRAVRDG